MSLVEIIEKINVARPFAEGNAEDGPVDTLAGRRGRKNQAIDTMIRLKRQYKQELLQSAVFIVVTGSLKSDFVTMATEGFKCFSADSEAFYNDLASRVSPALYEGKEGISNIFDVLGRYLEDKAIELDLSSYPQLIFKQQYRRVISNKEEFTALVKQAVNDQVGTEIVGIQAVNSLVGPAIDKGHADKITPIILSTNDELFANQLLTNLPRLTSRVFLVVAGKSTKALRSTDGAIIVKEVSEESLTQTMNTIRGVAHKK